MAASPALVPRVGSVFLARGIASLAVAVPVVLILPESIKFLAQRDLAQHRIAPILRQLSAYRFVARGGASGVR
jgi:AAHS family 4-hydroxybenzoate transporter-like MFS transporter